MVLRQRCVETGSAVAKYVYDYGLTDKDEISVDTLAGIKYLKLTIENGKVSKVRVNMGKPILKASEIPVKAEKEPVVAEAIEAGGRGMEDDLRIHGESSCSDLH